MQIGFLNLRRPQLQPRLQRQHLPQLQDLPQDDDAGVILVHHLGLILLEEKYCLCTTVEEIKRFPAFGFSMVFL